MRNKHFGILFILVLLHLMMFTLPVPAQDEDYVSPGPITGIDLGVSALQLSPGESYTFQIKFEPADTVLTTLDWYVTDENVISIDPLTDTVTALSNGTARIFAESFDQFSYAVCDVTVGDSVSKDASVMKSGSAFFDLSPEDLGKISAGTLTRYLDFVAGSPMDETSFTYASSRSFDVLAAVKPGTEEAQSELAKERGVEDSEPLKELNAITLYGSLEAILSYAKGNGDLREIFEFGPFATDEPELEEVSSESVQKAVGLKGNTEALTKISYAHSLGLKGKGRWIAVIDSGINRNNAQFNNGSRQIIEACFSKARNKGTYRYYSVCSDGQKAAGASAARLAMNKAKFNHGSHVTGIAAGRDGIAPLANIISIQSHTEKRWTCKANERKEYSCGSNSNQCCASHISNADLARAYDYILELSKTRKIDAVNMSYGSSTKYTSTCDSSNKFEKKYFDKFRAAGMLPVLSAGNSGYNGGVGNAACLSNAYTVANITMSSGRPVLAKSSNFSRKIDIAAPGVRIWSAGYSKDMMTMSGTSMAAPMVSGAVALVKQMYPGMTAEDAGEYLKTISKNTVNKRINSTGTFKYSKPVLTFDAIHKLNVPYFNWITGGDKSITFKVYRMAVKDVKFSAEVTTLSGQKITGTKTAWKNRGDFTYVRVSGDSLANGQIYKVKLKRSFNVGKTKYWSVSTQYGRPFNAAMSPKPESLDKGVSVTAGSGGAKYYIYDIATGKVVKQMNVTNAGTPTEIKGLVNGRLYAVSASSFTKINITKNGVKKAVNFYGAESGSVLFMPMSAPFNTKIAYSIGKEESELTSSADNAADGIMVSYRKSGEQGSWTPGCRSSNGKFSCTVSVGRGYDFRVQKYKTLKGKTYYGPVADIQGR